MASQEHTSEARQEAAEDQPLLGRPGDAMQDEEQSLAQNFIMGTGIVAQGGAVVLAVLIWTSVFTKPLILFAAHPVSIFLELMLRGADLHL